MTSLSRFEVVSFDCYGTLVDWETGILNVVRPLVERAGRSVVDDEILWRHAALESQLESGDYRSYRLILEGVLTMLSGELDFALEPGESELLADSVPDWPAFPDTVDALRRIRKHCRLAIISNVDDDLLDGTRARLEIDFDHVVTAQRVGSYKPSLRNFEVAGETFGVPRDRWLHAAQSLFHDIRPANDLGLTTVWVDRRRGREGSGATPVAIARPDVTVGSLEELAELFERG